MNFVWRQKGCTFYASFWAHFLLPEDSVLTFPKEEQQHEKIKDSNKKAVSILLTIILITSAIPMAMAWTDWPEEGDWPLTGTCGDCTFTLYANGSLYVNGTGVAGFGDDDFMGHRSFITNITFGEGVTKIREGSFSDLSRSSNAGYREPYDSVTRINIPSSVKTIGRSAFQGCSNLESIYYASDVESWLSIDFGYSANYTNQTWIAHSYDLYFRNLPASNITIPESIKEIPDYAFDQCSSLQRVSMPNSVTNIGKSAFTNCKNLQEITLSNEITEIGPGAFIGSALTEIKIPDKVTIIDSRAFGECSHLESITIPKSVQKIGWAAFSGCDSLADVYYSGTSQEWSQINIDKTESTMEDMYGQVHHYSNNPLLNAKIHFESSTSVVIPEPSTNPSDDPDTNPSAENTNRNGNFIQRIIQWFRDLFAKLFGWMKR